MKIIALFAILAACSPMHYAHGVPNLAQVDNAGAVWRSGEPTEEGWHYIETIAHGRTVHVVKLNFDLEGSDDVARKLGFDVRYLPIQPEGDQNAINDALAVFKSPDGNSVTAAMLLLSMCADDPDHQLCLVHCTHGQDRTGYVVGRFRVQHDHWNKSAAWHEMLAHHFHWELVGLVDAWEDFTP